MKPSSLTVTLPRALVRGRERFESWRQTRKRRRIPETLWREAVRLARVHGVHRTARVLRLNEQSLRERARSSESAHDSGPAASAAFVELQPLTVSRLPRIVGSAAKKVLQNEWLTTAAEPAPRVAASPGCRSLPMAGTIPRVWK